jgi:type II secretory pathway component PulJ
MAGTVKPKTESGVTLIEVMISAFVLTVALLGIAMTMVAGISSMYHTQEQLIAKQKAREALESVFTARSTQNVLFTQIQNNSVSGGIFLTGFQPIRGMGTDGIVNTADDAATPIETLVFPGADGLLGTADDESRPLSGFERKITITNVLEADGDVDADIRQISIEVRFKVKSVWHSVMVSSYVSRFA